MNIYLFLFNNIQNTKLEIHESTINVYNVVFVERIIHSTVECIIHSTYYIGYFERPIVDVDIS